MRIHAIISYNALVGGSAAQALRKILSDHHVKITEADYRNITPPTPEIDKIYEDSDFFSQTFTHAKLEAKKILADADCLIIPGNGTQIDSRLGRFNKNGLWEKNSPKEDKRLDLARNIAELALLHIALQKGLPIYASCGGHQILNVYLGGTLKELSEEDQMLQGFLTYAGVTLNPVSEVGQIFFPKAPQDEILHARFFGAHQYCIDKLGGEDFVSQSSFLTVTALAHDSSHNLEGFEANYGAPIYSFQFHPEVGVNGMCSYAFHGINYRPASDEEVEMNLRIIKAFLEAAKTYRQKKVAQAEMAIPLIKYSRSGIGIGMNQISLLSLSQFFSIFNELKTEEVEVKSSQSNPKRFKAR